MDENTRKELAAMCPLNPDVARKGSMRIFIGVFVAMIVFTLASLGGSWRLALGTDSKLDSHDAAQKVREEHSKTMLEKLERMISDLHKKQFGHE